MKRLVSIIFCFILGASWAFAASAEEQVREWTMTSQAVFQGTFVKYENGLVYIRLLDGTVRAFPKAMGASETIGYVQNRISNFPEMRNPQVGPDEKLLVDLNVEDLAFGPLQRWTNRGALGGAFTALNMPPRVESVQGRKCVYFDSSPWAVPMEFQSMVADFYAPKAFDAMEPFTVAAWLYNPSPLGIDGTRETLLAFQPMTGDDGVQIGYGNEGRYWFEKGLNGGAYEGPAGGMGFPDSCWPALNQWHHIAWVFTGGRDGRLLLYIDGKLGSDRAFQRNILNAPATDIGKTEATINADMFLRDGKPVKVTAFIGETDGKHWRWPEKWYKIVDLGLQSNSKISTTVTGLKPGTKYYYRFYLSTPDLPNGMESRWSDGAATFVTASDDGTPGRQLPKEDPKYVFLGCNWGINWVWDTKPNWLYTGGVGGVQVYQGALSEREIRNVYGSYSAYEPGPADGSETEDVATKLKWKPGSDAVKDYTVYLSEDKTAVESRSESARRGATAETSFDPGKLQPGKTYYWCVDGNPKDNVRVREGFGKGDIWSFTAYSARAAEPAPKDKSEDSTIYASRLKWKPGKLAAKQKVYFGTDVKSVEDGTTKWVSGDLGKEETSWVLRDAFPQFKMEYGRTYYWRVAQLDDAGKVVANGDVWQFKIGDYFTPEFDGLVSEPFPSAIKQDGYYGKIMECMGQPVVAAADCPDDPMRLCSYCVSKFLKKRPDVADVMEALNCGSHLDYGDRGWGANEFAMACYGSVRTYNLDPTFYWGINIMMHEMGHQYHMFGMEQTDSDFRGRLWDLYRYGKANGMWVGDYGANNPWEYIAVCASAFESDGSEDEVICRRETLRKSDPGMFYLLSDYWPGDNVVDLRALTGVQTSGDRGLTWENQGGLEYWGKFGLKKYPWSTGSFQGSAQLATVDGVSAVKFSGTDVMWWDKKTREFLIGNHAWAIELWANCQNDGTIAAWGPDDDGVRFGRTAYEQPHDFKGWHHLVYTFAGGGLNDTEGEYRLYFDGKLDSTGKFKHNIPGDQGVWLGGMQRLEGDHFVIRDGFVGALAHVRVCDYDLSDMQVKQHYNDERAYYQKRDKVAAAGNLLLDFDSRQLAPCPVEQTRPLYPESTGRDWVRSWYNRGLVGGKMSNDKHTPENSDPRVKVVDGVTSIEFRGDDRMVSSFAAPALVTGAQALSLESWVYRYPTDKGGTVLQWGGIELTGSQVQPGQWHLVTLTVTKSGSRLFIDGKPAGSAKSAAMPGELDRLHFGAHWDGWQWARYFEGAIAEVRLQSGALTAAQMAQNFAASDLQQALQPSPAVGARVAAERRPKLVWDSGVRASKTACDVYLSTDPKQAASAARGGVGYLGRAVSGQLAPVLKPGTTYYWRVDATDSAGRAVKGQVWSFQTYGGLLVNLDAAKLQPGKVESWANQGNAGGKFSAGGYGDQAAPAVVTVDGRKCLDFTGAKCLVSSFQAPKAMTGTGPFTVSVWAYKRWFNETETLVSWGSPAGGTAECVYGFGKTNGALKCSGGFTTGFAGPYDACDLYKNNSPMMLFWQHITYAYSGGPDGTLKVYVNGILNTEKQAKISTAADGKIAIGGLLNDAGRWDSPFSGFISDVAVYDKSLSQDEVKYLFDGTGTKPDDSNLLVKLASDGLAEGKVSSWKNAGRAGGEFTLPERKPAEPVAGTVAGRKAVTFDGRFSFMKSSFNAPTTLTWRNPFTVETWVYNPTVDWGETVFSMAPRLSFTSTMLEDYIKRAAEFRYGTGDDRTPGAFYTGWDYHNTGWAGGKFPAAAQWHHIAYVCDGRHQGTLTIFVDGKPASKREWFTLATTPGLPMFLGTAWNTETGASDMFSGSIASLMVYDYARTPGEVATSAKAK